MKVLMTRHSEGWEHSYLPHAEVAIKKMGKESGLFEAVTTARSRLITAEELAKYDVLVMATTGELPWNDEQKQAFLDFVAGGKGLVGIHNATDTFYKWPEYGELIGGWFRAHPWTQEVGVKVEEPDHPAVAMLGESFRVYDEIYTLRDWDRSKHNVLMSLDNDTVDLAKGTREDHDYALGWYNDYGKGRVIYTALGHPDDLWDQPWFLEHILACIKWAGRLV
jgi:type 1 glutamine amidotransferase